MAHITINGKTYDLEDRKSLVAATNVLFSVLERFFDNHSRDEHWMMLLDIIKQQEKGHQRFRPTTTPRTVTLQEATRHFAVRAVIGGLGKLNNGHDVRTFDTRLDFVLGQVIATNPQLVEYLRSNGVDSWVCEVVRDEFDYCVLSN